MPADLGSCSNCKEPLKPVPIIYGLVRRGGPMDEWGVAFGGCVVTPGRPWFACGGCGNRLTASGRGDRTLLQAFLEEVDRRYSRGEISATVVSEIRALYART